VIYKDNYVVDIISNFMNKQFRIDISKRDKDYLKLIYNSDGTLKKPLRGMVSPIIELRPILNESTNRYDLQAMQRVVGYYNADTLGMIKTHLRYNGSEFAMVNNEPRLNVFGNDIDISNTQRY
jgi:hypothetical protein